MRLRRSPAADRPRVLLLAPSNSYRIVAYQAAADALGVDLLVASEGKHALVPEVAHGLHVDLTSPPDVIRRIKKEASRRPISGVLVTDDSTVELGCLVAEALGLSHNPPVAARLSRRKDLARDALRRAGLPVPRYQRLDLAAGLSTQWRGIHFPCVVKPLAMSGSRGVIRADDRNELTAAVARIEEILRRSRCDGAEGRYLLVEEFLPGPEIAVEGILHAGRLHVVAIFDKPDPLNGPFFEETYYVTPSRLSRETTRLIERRVQEATVAYGLREGPVHAELRISDGDAWIIELAARTIGGSCARLIGMGSGWSLEQLVLSHALGRRPDVRTIDGAAGVLMIPIPRAGVLRRVEGVLAARNVPLVEDLEIAVREGYELVPVPEGSSYLGFIFARGSQPDLVEAALRKAHDCLKIIIAPAWRLERA